MRKGDEWNGCHGFGTDSRHVPTTSSQRVCRHLQTTRKVQLLRRWRHALTGIGLVWWSNNRIETGQAGRASEPNASSPKLLFANPLGYPSALWLHVSSTQVDHLANADVYVSQLNRIRPIYDRMIRLWKHSFISKH